MSTPPTEPAHSAESDAQRIEWEAHARAQHAKGICEYSGLRARSCVRSICDCFETPENAAAMERECACSLCVTPPESPVSGKTGIAVPAYVTPPAAHQEATDADA
jgi:hypothetical protein